MKCLTVNLVITFLFSSLFIQPLVGLSMSSSSPGNKTATRIFQPSGLWQGFQKNDSTFIRFVSIDKSKEWLSYTAYLSKDLKKSGPSTFFLKTNTGEIRFTGIFDKNGGSGRFTYDVDVDVQNAFAASGIRNLQEHNNLGALLSGITPSYILQIKTICPKKALDKSDFINFYTLGIDSAYLTLLELNGYGDLSASQIINLKVLQVNNNIFAQFSKLHRSFQSLVSKSTDRIKNYRSTWLAINEDADHKNNTNKNFGLPINTYDVESTYISKLQKINCLPGTKEELIAYVSDNISAEYIEQFNDLNTTKIIPLKIIALKALDTDRDYIIAFRNAGYSEFSIEDCFVLKYLNITADYPKSLALVGYKGVPVNALFVFKWYDVTPSYIRSICNSFGSIKTHWTSILECKVDGVTPQFIDSAKQAGFNYSDLEQYVVIKKRGY